MTDRQDCAAAMATGREISAFPEQTPVAMAYIPYQRFSSIYPDEEALCIGTIFPELNLPFTGRRPTR